MFTGENIEHFAGFEFIKDRLGLGLETSRDKALFINVAYDRQLIEHHDNYGIPQGEIDITDRKKLLKLLGMLDKSKTYEYIFLDVRFEEGYSSEVDSLLFAKIKSMKKIVVANHNDIELADGFPKEKAAINDFSTTIISTNFARYKYLYDIKPSMALYAYNELTGKYISDCLLWYASDGKLCYNSLFLQFPIEDFSEYDNEGHKQIYNLGTDILNEYSEQELCDLTAGKYIVIGDMVEDLHDTYSGKKPGSVITYYAFRGLMDGNHYVSLWLTITMALVFFVISYLQLSHKPLVLRIPLLKRGNNRILFFIISFVEYTILLLLLAFVLDVVCGLLISIALPTIWFTIQKYIIAYKRFEL